MRHSAIEDSDLVLTMRQVFESAESFLYVARCGGDPQWQFFPKGFLDRAEADTVLVSFKEVLSLDPGLEELRDLPMGWHAWRETEHSAWSRDLMPQGQVYCLCFTVFPTEDHSEFEVVGECMVYCWIVASSPDEAEQVARESLSEQSFDCREFESCELVASEDECEEGVQYYRQALVDGAVFIQNISPKYPVYYLEFTVAPLREHGDSTVRKAAFLIVNEAVDASGDCYERGFWNQERVQAAEVEAVRAIRKAGWGIVSEEASRPCCYDDVPRGRHDLYDEAESEGMSLGFWRE